MIHTVDPVWRGGRDGEAETLADCYRACLAIAAEERFAALAFPAISTGIYGYPLSQATMIAVETCRAAMENQPYPQKIVFVCFSAEAEAAYRETLAHRGPAQ